MLGALTSLTGGGGLSNSSAASSQTGQQSQDGTFHGGGVSFGTGNEMNASMVIAAVTVLAVVWLISNRKK
ncbi:hypothetical protein [Shewanella maritima]|uniref:hypothetical protein n=1 Tax=Shewanella maritima TaxID=2520507 RepID=UPI0037354288